MSMKGRDIKERAACSGKGGSRIYGKYGRFALWGLLFVCLIFCIPAFLYGDIEATFDNTVLLAKAIQDGEFLHFYEYSLEHAQTYWPAGYDILLYIFFGIWNLPAILCHLIGGFAYLESPIALLWCKGLTVVFAAGMAWMLYRIVRLCDGDKEEGLLAVFLMLSGVSLAAPVFIVGQYDTLPLFFMLGGLYYYLKEEEWKCYLCFWISIPLKIYGLFLLLPLILLKEKRIGAILVKTAGICSLYVLLKLLFVGDSVYSFISGSQGKYGTDKLLNAAVEYSGYDFCLFLGAYAAICIFCYWKRLEGAKEMQWYPLYVCFLVFAAFAALVAINDYWIIFYLPFAVLLMVRNRKNFKINVLIETVTSGMYLLYAFINKVYPYSYPELVTERFVRLFMKVPDEERRLYGTVKIFMEHMGLQPYAQSIHTLFVVGMISLAVVNRPAAVLTGEEKKGENGERNKEDRLWEKEQGLLFSRVLAFVFSVFLLLYANLKGGNPVLYSTLHQGRTSCGVNLLEEAEFVQKLSFDSGCELGELTLYFDNDGYVKDNFGSVWVRLTDGDTGELLLEERIGASMTQPGEPCRISLAGIYVEPGKEYILFLQGAKGINGSNYVFSPWVTVGMEKGYPAVVNGEYQDYNLYMQIR